MSRSVRRPSRAVVGAALAAILALAGCGGDAGSAGSPSSSAAPSATDLTGTITVLAAASLTETFTRIGADFEKAHAGVQVDFSFGASSALAQQAAQGAPADVFAAASKATMVQAVDAGAVAGEPRVFARNRLQIAVPSGNPAGVTGLSDFADDDLRIALCAEQVPCGAAAAKAFEAAGVEPAPDTLEQDVKATLTKVSLGEVDAGLVYRTDVLAAGDKVEGIDFPEAAEAVNDYPVAVLEASENPTTAEAFVAYVESPAGRSVLAAAGFDVS